MAKYIIDVPKDRVASDGKLRFMACIDSPLANWIYTGIFAEPFDRKAIEDEVWSIAREIAYCMSLQECIDTGMLHDDDIYNSASGVLEKLTYQEAKAKFEVWRKQKDEIRVGDEVIYNSRTRAVVLMPETKERYGTILTSEFDTISVSHDDLEKTGRHFEEVEKLLKK